MRIKKRKLILWGLLFVVSVMTGALIFAYTYVTDSDTLVAVIKAQAKRYFPNSHLSVRRAQLRPLIGQLELSYATLAQVVDDKPFSTASVPWVHIRCDAHDLWRGTFNPKEIAIAQPVLRLVKHRDGHWNLQNLLADPWPHDPEMQPVVRVSKGVLELVDGHEPAMVLHNVELLLEPDAPGLFRFEGSAQGDAFQRLVLAGTIDAVDGAVSFSQIDLTGLALSDALRQRLPIEWADAWDDWGVAGGELDVLVERLVCTRKQGVNGKYAVQLALRNGSWSCHRLPFPLRDVTASARLEDNVLTVQSAEGHYGKTDVTLHEAVLDLGVPDPSAGPLRVDVSVNELELDAALRAQMPDAVRAHWDQITREGRRDLGRISLRAHLERAAPDAPLRHEVAVDLLDAAFCFQAFPFPLEHLRGRLVWAGDNLVIHSVETVIDSKPISISGHIEDLSGDPTLTLDIKAGALPMDEHGSLVGALPAAITDVVKQFHPAGSVRGTAHIERHPANAQGQGQGDPWGDVRVTAALDLNEGCSMRWDGMSYPIQHLKGHLELHPTGCTFTNMHGDNGIAHIAGAGRVEVLADGRFAADVMLHAHDLPFDQQLHDALPNEWRATWDLLKPMGTCTLDAHVVAGWPDKNTPDLTDLKILVRPEDEAVVNLEIKPAPGTPGVVPGQMIKLPAMRKVVGRFRYLNGHVSMNDVAFGFREAPVTFKKGHMTLAQDGRLDLGVEGLEFSGLRLDAELRKIMPPVMASFAQRLDENKPLAGQGNLGIFWSGNPLEPAQCSWDHVKIFLNDMTIMAGGRLEHIQGELSNLAGKSNGQGIEMSGFVDLPSLIVSGVQVSMLRAPLAVQGGKAILSDVQAKLLDGDVRGGFEMSIDTPPRYSATLDVVGADLARLAQSMPGHQKMAGKITGHLQVAGLGGDLRQLSGSGEATLSDADLVELPWVLGLLSQLKLVGRERAAFDAGRVMFQIEEGVIDLSEITIRGRSFHLEGHGQVDLQGDVQLTLKPLPGREGRLQIPGLSGATSAASGQVLRIHVSGPLGSPTVKWAPLPGPTRLWQRMTDRPRGGREGASDGRR